MQLIDGLRGSGSKKAGLLAKSHEACYTGKGEAGIEFTLHALLLYGDSLRV